MAEMMTAKARLMEGMRFMAESGSGHTVTMDASGEHGREDLGFRPMELLLVGLAGCTAMDVISILRKKRQEVRGYTVAMSGVRTVELAIAGAVVGSGLAGTRVWRLLWVVVGLVAVCVIATIILHSL